MEIRELVELTEEQIENLIVDDPVRPHISCAQRISMGKVVALKQAEKVLAVCCIAFCYGIPKTENDLLQVSFSFDELDNRTIVPYTIWSYEPGSGRALVRSLLDWVKNDTDETPRVVTLSPKTEMAKKFHLSNGATLLQTNEHTYNFEYDLRE